MFDQIHTGDTKYHDSNGFPWTKANCLKLLPFCKPQDIPKLHTCCEVCSEKDERVIKRRITLIASDIEDRGRGEAFDEIEDDNLSLVGSNGFDQDVSEDVLNARTVVDNRKDQ
eukprot:6477084-Ditylum_brightwellii.AAC.1